MTEGLRGEEYPGDGETARDKVRADVVVLVDVVDTAGGQEATRALRGVIGSEIFSFISERIVSRESSWIIGKMGRRGSSGGPRDILSGDDDDVGVWNRLDLGGILVNGEDSGKDPNDVLADALRLFLTSCILFVT